MITISNINKSFGEIQAVDNITLTIEERQVFGLIGTNGAGKSTLLRMMAGVLLPDSGEVLIDGENVYDAPPVKEKLFFIPDEAYFFQNANALDMKKYYAGIYRGFDSRRFDNLMSNFNLSPKIKISTYSKGMKKQLSLILGIAANTRYLYCDETFDGLDPVMRQAAKSLLANDIEKREFTNIFSGIDTASPSAVTERSLIVDGYVAEFTVKACTASVEIPFGDYPRAHSFGNA